MEINNYQDTVYQYTNYPKEIGLVYNTLAINSACGELSKRMNQAIIENKQLDKTTILKIGISIGDVLNSLANLATDLDLTLDEIIALNMKKLIMIREKETKEANSTPIKDF